MRTVCDDQTLMSVRPALECGRCTQFHSIKGNWFFSPAGVSFKELLVQGGILCPLLFLHSWILCGLNFYTFCAFCHSLCVHKCNNPIVSGKCMKSLLLFHVDPWALRGGSRQRRLFRTGWVVQGLSLSTNSSLLINSHLPQEEAHLLRSELCTVCGIICSTLLGVILLLCSFSRMRVDVSLSVHDICWHKNHSSLLKWFRSTDLDFPQFQVPAFSQPFLVLQNKVISAQI